MPSSRWIGSGSHDREERGMKIVKIRKEMLDGPLEGVTTEEIVRCPHDEDAERFLTAVDETIFGGWFGKVARVTSVEIEDEA